MYIFIHLLHLDYTVHTVANVDAGGAVPTLPEAPMAMAEVQNYYKC
jgi:hypothetical protein